MTKSVTISEISKMANCCRNAAWNWKIFPDFPKPIGKAKGKNHWNNDIYSAEAAMHWLIKHGKIPVPEGYQPLEAQHQATPAPDDEKIKNPQLDNILAGQFLTGGGKQKAPRITVKQAARNSIRTEGIWPLQ